MLLINRIIRLDKYFKGEKTFYYEIIPTRVSLHFTMGCLFNGCSVYNIKIICLCTMTVKKSFITTATGLNLSGWMFFGELNSVL